MTLQIPSLFEVTTASEFLKNLIALNKDRRGFSQRGLSTRLKWPSSYIPDVIKGRKKFTIIRAVQLGRYLSLDAIDLEKLILIAVADLGYISQAEAHRLQEIKSPKRTAPTKDSELLDAHVFLVLEIIRWFKGHATLDDLNQLVQVQGLKSQDVLRALRILHRKKIVTVKNKRYIAKDLNLMSDDILGDDVKIHTQFSEFFRNFLRNRFGPAVYNASIVHCERAKFEQIADKITALRNWLHEISAKDQMLSAEKDVRLFQLDLNLTPLFSKDTAKELRSRRR